ncbi:hypothetical protein C0992_011744, partial [Termitomyces sp. T32_za158]
DWTDLRSGTHTADQQHLKTVQAKLEGTLVKIITAPEQYPAPGRALRNIAGRCLVTLYTRGETRTLFDTLQVFMKVVGDFKATDKETIKMCVLERTFRGVADNSIFLKSSILRFHALVALRKSLATAKRAVTESALKDILKQMRNCVTDKSLPVQREAAYVIIAIYSGADASHPSASDVENIVNICIRSLENADQATRHSLAQLVGHMLASTQIERAVPVPESPQKVKKDEDDTDAGLSSAVTAAEIKKPTLTPTEMLNHLSNHFNRPNVSRKTRTGIFDFYAALFTRLGPTFVEPHFALIVSHLMTEIVSSPRNITTRYETLHVRSLVGILLRDLIGVRMLSEQGQISAIQELANAYLKRWPAMMPGQTAPSSKILVIALREVAGLLQQLGNAPPPVQDALADPLVTLLSHPSHTTRINAAWTLRCFCYSTPLRLPKTILTVTELLQRDMTSIVSPAAPSDINLRALGHAYGLAALVSIIPERPLYVSYDVSAKVLDMAISLLKRAGEHDLKVAGVEVEVAWTSIASLMALGPNFVRPHLPQLLVLWRNALPKPTSKDANTTRSVGEWMFLLHVRESALSAILCFLQHNSSTLVTLDVGRRIASLLSNVLSFANNFISQHVEDSLEAQQTLESMKGLSLRSSEALLRRRVYQCFTALGFSSLAESTQATLLQSAVSLFASPDGYAGSSVQAAIASSSGTFTSVWQTVDGYAYGVTSNGILDVIGGVVGDDPTQGGHDYLNRDAVELRKPILGACEHDPLSLCQVKVSNSEYKLLEPPPPATSVVDTAIELFAQLLPLQDLTSTTRVITQLLESVRSPKLEKNSGRKAAVINAASLAYAPFVSSTLGMLLKIYLMESHEREGGTLPNANLSGDHPAYPVVCQIIDAVISVLGPDMQESARTRTLILNLVCEFSVEDDEGICVEAIKCIQHFLMFAPEYINIPDLVTQFRSHLSSTRRPLKIASINALYQLVQKDALVMSKLGGDQLVEDLFGMLDDDSSVQGVRNVISSWLEQTVVHNPSAWIDLCQRIMSRTTASQQVADAASRQGPRDDEGDSLNLGMVQEGASGPHPTSRWRTQLFALQCLHHICTIVARSGRREQLDAAYARTLGLPTKGLLVSRVPDLIKMAFTASAAYVTEIRLEGLVVLRDVIEVFAKVPDPAYPDALLLEQHQAPITAALTPAFSSDSTPEILASAIHACAVFVGCGVVTDVGRMGRILKLLTTALDQSKADSGMLSIGETGELSPNASAMLRISTLSAWAQLQVATPHQKYLENVVKPHRGTLSSLWIAFVKREEPTAFFYIIFGLVYEALVTSSVDSTSTSSARQSLILSSLQALRCLVRPEYSGNALKEPTIFDEICSYIIQHSTSASRGQAIQGEPSDRIKLITTAFSAIYAVASSIESPRREEIRAVAILLYSGASIFLPLVSDVATKLLLDLLKDESSEIDLVGSTLPALKMILVDLPLVSGPGSQESYERLVHGLLSSCLLNIDAMSGRNGLISDKKVKNNMLATVLVLTVIPSSIKVSRAVIEHCCFLISQKLLGSGELSLTAAHCAKTLVVASSAGSPMLHHCVRLLIPGLVEYVAKMAPLVQDGTVTEGQITAIGEVWKAFSAFFSSTPEIHRVRLLGVLLPTIALLLSTSQVPATPLVSTQMVSQLLQYATSSPAAFKDAAAKLEPDTRELLEQSLRRAVGGGTSTPGSSATKPQISLRSF